MEKGGGHPFHTRGQYLTCVRSSSISEQAFSLSLFKTSISFLLKKKVNSITDESLLTVVTVVAGLYTCSRYPTATGLLLSCTVTAAGPIGSQPGSQRNPASTVRTNPPRHSSVAQHMLISLQHVGVLFTPRSITINTALHLLTSAVKRAPAPNLGKMVLGGKKPFRFQNCCNVTVIAG